MKITNVDVGIWRGPEPKTQADKQQLKDLGVKYSLDLESGVQLFKDGSPLAEALSMATFGIRVLGHPLGEISPPTEDEMRLAGGVLVNYPNTYVHCKAGVDRTGMICAWYRINVQKWPVEKAVAEMKAMGMHWWYYWWAGRLK